MLLISNGTVYTPKQIIPDGAVLVDGSVILAVGTREQIISGDDFAPVIQHLDAEGGSIVPGFINMHIHGVGGYDVMDGTVSSLQMMSRLLARNGVTSWVPTLDTAPLKEIEKVLSIVRKTMDNNSNGARILGAHIEGPYLNNLERGAHPSDLLLNPLPDEYGGVLKYADIIRVFTLAPELPGALELITQLKQKGVLVSAGHSVALNEEIENAVDAGLSHATHMFCNMGTLRRLNIRRVAGVVESVLLDDRISTEIITDGYHISPSLMKLALKVKGLDKLAIITDGSGLTGLPSGNYSMFNEELTLEKNIVYLADRSAYAGSASTMDHCLRCAMESMNLTLSEAIQMASLTPAKLLGLSMHKGSLEASKDADITILDTGNNVTNTVVSGSILDRNKDIRMEKGGVYGLRMVL